jgi:hypothetical protein
MINSSRILLFVSGSSFKEDQQLETGFCRLENKEHGIIKDNGYKPEAAATQGRSTSISTRSLLIVFRAGRNNDDFGALCVMDTYSS